MARSDLTILGIGSDMPDEEDNYYDYEPPRPEQINTVLAWATSIDVQNVEGLLTEEMLLQNLRNT